MKGFGNRATAELGIDEGVVSERMRDMAHVDSVKEVRLKAAERIVQIQANEGR